jgi:hypothetical protein
VERCGIRRAHPKKLVEAAALIARGFQQTDEAGVIAEAEALGLDPESIASLRKELDEAEDDAFAVLEENMDVVLLFIRCLTQLRRSGFSGIPTGLDYAGVQVVANVWHGGLTREMLEGINTMEVAYIREARKIEQQLSARNPRHG